MKREKDKNTEHVMKISQYDSLLNTNWVNNTVQVQYNTFSTTVTKKTSGPPHIPRARRVVTTTGKPSGKTAIANATAILN